MSPTFAVFGLELASYPALILAGLLLVWLLIVQRTTALGWPRDGVIIVLLLAFPAGAIGGRIVAWATEVTLTGTEPGGYAGMTVLGSIVGSLSFAGLAVPRLVRVRPLAFLDAVAFSMPLALIFGRLGCLALGCCHGSPAPADAPSWLTLRLAEHAPDSMPRVLLDGLGVETIWNLPLLFVIQQAIIVVAVEAHYRWPRGRAQVGATAGLCLVLDALGRAWIEGFRAGPWTLEEAVNPWAALTWAYLAIVLLGFVAVWTRSPTRAEPHS